MFSLYLCVCLSNTLYSLASIATLYILEYHRRHHHLGPPPVYAPGPAPSYGYANVNNIDYHHYPSQSSISSPSSLSTPIHGKAPNSIDGFKGLYLVQFVHPTEFSFITPSRFEKRSPIIISAKQQSNPSISMAHSHPDPPSASVGHSLWMFGTILGWFQLPSVLLCG